MWGTRGDCRYYSTFVRGWQAGSWLDEQTVLYVPEPAIGPLAPQQRSLCAAFRDAAMLQNEDLIDPLQADEAVSDEQGGLFLHQVKQSSQYLAFGDGVQVGGGFVQKQDRGILQD